MTEQKYKEQVELIRQVFEYAHRFKGKIFVLQLECSLLGHPFFPILVKDLVLLHRLGIRTVLVPAAKSRIDEILDSYHIDWQTVDGVRISTSEAIPFIKMAAFDVSNQLMTQLAENSAGAVIGNWVRARGMGVRGGVDFQYTGMVEKVASDIILEVLNDGLIPIFPNIGWSAAGRPYNISSTELAFALSCALNAEKLFFITDSRGIKAETYRLGPDLVLSPEGTVTQLTVAEARKFLDLNEDKKGDEILEMLSLAYEACRRGVSRVHILDGTVEGVLLKEIFSNVGFGTMVYSNQHENIRAMAQEDIPGVLRIMQPFMEKGILLKRREQDLLERCADYVVYEVDGMVHACAALHLFPEGQGEIAGIAVDETYAGLGIGKRIVSFLLEKARKLGLKRVFALTIQTADWFLQLGFREGEVAELPEARRACYDRKRNSKVLVFDLRANAGA